MENWVILYWLIFFGVVLITGSETNYLHPRLTWLLWMGIGAMGAMLLAGLVSALRGKDKEACSCGCHGEDGSHVTYQRAFFHVIPLILFSILAVWGDQDLGVDSLNNDFSMSFQVTEGEDLPVDTTTDSDGYLETDILEICRSARFHSGEPKVSVIGMAYVVSDKEKIPEGVSRENFRVLVIRYLMSCCAACAQPVQVSLVGVPAENLQVGKWYRVRGTSGVIGEKNNIPRILVDDFKQVEKPANPYLYP